MRPKIGPGDYETKMNQAYEFLDEGKHVKFTIQFRGRQPVSIQEIGTQFFEKIKNDILKRDIGTLMEEKETKSPAFWSKVFFIKER
jgi:translation initiation factor IF-3